MYSFKLIGLIVFFSFTSIINLFSQNLERKLVGSGGQTFSNTIVQINYSIGEPIIDAKYVPFIYTQGFQQSNSIFLIPPYCKTQGVTSREFINSFTFEKISNISGNNNGYGNFKSQIATLKVGTQYSFSITPSWLKAKRGENYKIWIDYNRDGKFDNITEAVFELANSSSTKVKGYILVPANILSGNIGLRVSMKSGSMPVSCEENFQGEVEDYTINIAERIQDIIAPSVPTNLTASNITTTSFSLSWTSSIDNIAVSGYDVYVNNSLYSSTLTNTTSIAITGLSPNTTYSVFVRAKDASNNISGNSNILQIKTLALSPIYCIKNGSSNLREFINRFELGSINNLSGANSGGYGNFTNIQTNLLIGSSNPFTLTPGWKGSIRSEAYRIWIDFNRDGDFIDNGELVFSQNKTTLTKILGNIKIPSSTSIGITRMRIIMKYNSLPTSCESSGFAGEIEDYTINIVSPVLTSSLNKSINQLDSETTFEIYPNPVSQNKIYVKTIGFTPEKICIYDLTGRIVKIIKGIQVIDISLLSSGTYIIALIDKDQIWYKKFIKI